MIALLMGIVAGTLVLEDAACIAAGLLAASGAVSFAWAAAAAAMGLFLGDLALYAAGRSAAWTITRLGVNTVRLEPLAAWMRANVSRAVWVARFTPGLRLPAFTSAGWGRVPVGSFTAWLAVACLVWAPLLVGAAMLAGQRVAGGVAVAAPVVALSWAAFRWLSDWKRRRRIVGRLLRIVRWEFWPIWAAYLPLVPYLLFLVIRHRSLTAFAAANPSMHWGGLTGESKSQILAHLAGFAAAHTVVPQGGTWKAPAFPVVAKPDRGERGSGVAVIRTQQQLDEYLAAARDNTIVQEYVGGEEYGILCHAAPGATRFSITSITHKTFPSVTGNGTDTVEELILRDSRAVCLAGRYALELGDARMQSVPAAGERVRLVEIGSHSRGSVFLDAMREAHTPELEAAVDRAARAHPGFRIGRFDVRTPSLAALRRGEFTVLELNGVASEPTHIYDPAVPVWAAYRALAAHWRMVFAIGAAAASTTPVSVAVRESSPPSLPARSPLDRPA